MNIAAAISKINIAANLFYRQRNAEEVFHDGLEMHKQADEESDWHLANAYVWLDRCLIRLQRYDEAEGLLLQDHQLMSDVLGENHERTIDVVGRIVDLYQICKKHDDASRWMSRLPEAETVVQRLLP